jgi:DMSO/TMAO reductase YedYZ molybdopterin-dependent catalytic subunit
LAQREGIRPPKFADKFAMLDFEAEPMPAISLYPLPLPQKLTDLSLDLCGLDCKPRQVGWRDLCGLPEVSMVAPLICQIFNWSELVEWGGMRFMDVADRVGLELPEESYVSFHSRDGVYFEALPSALARDPRVLLATKLNRTSLPEQNGGPLRLVVPFLQGYKSVKWLGAVRVTRHDPIGIKRLLGQSKTGHLGKAWRARYAIHQEDGAAKTPV